jgi:penicillin-binding protein 1B
MTAKTKKKKSVRRPRKPRSNPTAKPSRQPQKPSTGRRLRRAIAPLALLMTGLIFGVFYVIDHRVTARLNSLTTPKLPVIYSSPLDVVGLVKRLDDDPSQNTKLLRTVLADRRYSEVSGSPSRPGEYSLSADTLTIFSRSFTTPAGQTVPSKKQTLPIGSSASDSSARVLLEPQVISYIGSADVRASSYVPLANIPAIVQLSVLSIEDERFYNHFGLDLLGIARAMFRNLLSMRLVQGGSTLTQQLAKNMFLSPKRTISRKLLEIPTAISLERHLSKEQLLELYLNEVYLGQEGAVAIHGMPEAASAFFGKKLEDLRSDEAATLAGMIKAPSSYNPRRFPERARERRDLVLQKLLEHGHITNNEHALALKRSVKTVGQQEHRRLAPFYTSALESELSQGIDLDAAASSGLAVYTGLDLGIQRCAEQAIEDGLVQAETANPKLKNREGPVEAALVAIEPYSGLVKAWVGGRDFGSSQFNRVNQSTRQIGSTMKPFLYLSALDGSLNSYKVATAASILEDKPVAVSVNNKTWNPENYDHEFRGDVSLRYALEHSLNMPALYISERIGIEALKRTATLFKLSDHVQAVPALALGALDTNLLRLTAAYAALANGGIYVTPRTFISAVDGDGSRLLAGQPHEERVSEENATFVLTHILQGVIERGTAKAVRTKGFTRPSAGKTGTSDNARDAWFVGFTPNLAAGVWVGLDDNSPLGLTGGSVAAPIWGEFMKCSAPFFAEAAFIPPRGVISVPIDGKTGRLATPACPQASVTQEMFVQGTEPRTHCADHGSGDESEDPPSSGAERTTGSGGFWGSIFRQ